MEGRLAEQELSFSERERGRESKGQNGYTTEGFLYSEQKVEGKMVKLHTDLILESYRSGVKLRENRDLGLSRKEE